MLPFSEREYQNLRENIKEIRGCITRYIGFIIALTGVSGYTNYILNTEDRSATSMLLLACITLLILTLLFEVIWYKFKSHNRVVGYMQLLMQEENAIIYNPSFKKNKDYIENYKDYIIDHSKLRKLIENLPSWEIVVARLHNNFFARHFDKNENSVQSTISATSRCKFVFSIPSKYYDHIIADNYDEDFFNKIVFKIYEINNDERSNQFKKMSNIITSFLYLFSSGRHDFSNQFEVDKKYLSTGWIYPLKITQISFLSVSLIYFYSLYISINNFSLSFSFSNIEIEPTIYSIFLLNIFIVWIFRYVVNLKDLIYGKYSIDSYCWLFFLFRVQFLNSRNIIPIYFSRNFIRFFKTNIYIKNLNNNSKIKGKKYFLIYEKEVKVIYQNILDYLNKDNTQNLWKKDVIHGYINNLINYKEFKTPEERMIHNLLVHKIKRKLNII